MNFLAILAYRLQKANWRLEYSWIIVPTYKLYKHSIYVFFINDYDEQSIDLVPVGEYGAIGNEVEVKIFPKDFEDIRRFVKLNHTNISKLVNKEMDIVEFYKLMIPLTK